MKVKLLNYTSNPDETVASAARMCYSAKGAEAIQQDLDQIRARELVTKLKQMGHESPFEHVSFTFAIEGVSRTLSHQLVYTDNLMNLRGCEPLFLLLNSGLYSKIDLT